MTDMWEVGWENLYYNGKPASPIPVSGLMQLHTKTEADYTYLNEFLYTAGDHRIFHVGKPDEAPELVAYLPPSEHTYQWIWVVDPEREIGARNICAVLTVSGQIYELDYNATDKTCEVRPWFQLPCEVEDYISGQIGGGVLRMQAHTSESRELLDGFTIPARAEQEKEEYLKFLKQVYVATDVLNYTIQTGETVHENEEAKAQYAEQFEIL